jgi:hypothetical protein
VSSYVACGEGKLIYKPPSSFYGMVWHGGVHQTSMTIFSKRSNRPSMVINHQKDTMSTTDYGGIDVCTIRTSVKFPFLFKMEVEPLALYSSVMSEWNRVK